MNNHTRHQFRNGVISLIALVAVLLCGVFAPLYANAAKTNSKIDGLNSKLDQLDDQKKQLESDIADAKDQKADAVEQKNQLDSEIANLEEQITTINGIIEELDADLVVKDAQVADLEVQIDEKYELFKKRMRSSYEPVSYTHLDVYKRQIPYRGRCWTEWM